MTSLCSRVRLVALVAIVGLASCSTKPSQPNPATPEQSAAKNADAYLAALKIVEIPEGAQAARQEAWTSIGKLPVLQDYTKLYEGMFDTDVSGVKGYKRLVQAKIQSEARTPLETKYILISYPDRKSGQWRVWAFVESQVSVEENLQYFKEELGSTRYTKDQFNYTHYAFWLIVTGKLKEAKLACEKAIALNNGDPDPKFETLGGASETLRIIKAIVEGT